MIMIKHFRRVLSLVLCMLMLSTFVIPNGVINVYADSDKSEYIKPDAEKANAATLAKVNALLTDYAPNAVEEKVKRGVVTFTHPGIGMTKAMLDNMQQNVRAGNEPWASAFVQFSEDYQASLPGSGWGVDNGFYAPYTEGSQRKTSKNPKIFVDPSNNNYINIGGGQNTWGHHAVFSILHDGDTAMSQALMYYITGDETYRANAMQILRGWGQIQTCGAPFDVQIRVSLGVYQMAFAADLLKQTPCKDPESPLNWTGADTAAFNNFLEVTKPYYNRDWHFMNQHDFCTMATTAAGIFLNDDALYAAGIERTATNDSRCTQQACIDAGGHCKVYECDLNRTGSIKYQIREMTKNDLTGDPLLESHIQVIEMGRDIAHSWCDLGSLAQVAMMSICQGTTIDPDRGTISTASGAVNMFNFLDDRILDGYAYISDYNYGIDVPYTTCFYRENENEGNKYRSEIAGGSVNDPSYGVFHVGGANVRGRFDPVLGPIYAYYTYIESKDLASYKDNKYENIYAAYNSDWYSPERCIEDFWGNGVLFFTLWDSSRDYIPNVTVDEEPVIGEVTVTPNMFMSKYSTQVELNVAFMGRNLVGETVNIYLTNDGGITKYGETTAVISAQSDPYGLINSKGVATVSFSDIVPSDDYNVVAEVGGKTGSASVCKLAVLPDIEGLLADAIAAYDPAVTYTIESRANYLKALAAARAAAEDATTTYAELLAAVAAANTAAANLNPYLNPDMGSSSLIDYVALKDMITWSRHTSLSPGDNNNQALIKSEVTAANLIYGAADKAWLEYRTNNADRAHLTMDFGVGMGVVLEQVELQARMDQNGFPDRIPGTQVQGSVNGTDWVPLTNKAVNSKEVQTFEVTDTTAYRYIRVTNTTGTGSNAQEWLCIGAYRIYGDIVQIPSESLTSQDIADTFVSLDPIPRDATRLKLPGVAGYTVTIESSSDESVIKKDGTIIVPAEETAIELKLRFKNNNDGTYADTALITVVVPGGSLTGTASITGMSGENGEPLFGDVLKAELADTNNTGILTYTWWINGIAAQSSTNDTYEVLEADYLNKIKVEITSSVQPGSIFSEETQPVDVDENTMFLDEPRNFKGIPGYAQLTLTWESPVNSGNLTIIKYEVSKDGGATWVDADSFTQHVFKGLNNGTVYTCAVRAVADDKIGVQASLTATPTNRIVISPIQDAFVHSGGNANTVMSTTDILITGKDRTAFMMFDLSGYDFSMFDISKITANLRIVSHKGAGQAINYNETETTLSTDNTTLWAANNLTFNNRPNDIEGGTKITSASVNATAGAVSTHNLSAIFQEALENGRTLISLQVQGANYGTQNNALEIRSIRYANEGDRPILTLVLPEEEAPTITSGNTHSVANGTGGTFQVTATGTPRPVYSLTGAPAGVTIASDTGLISIAEETAAGEYEFTIKASNGVGTDATQTFTLIITEAPTITSADNHSVVYGTVGTFQVTATGTPTITYSLTGEPTGVTIASDTGLMIIEDTLAVDEYTFTVTASNGVSSDAIQTFTLTVTDVSIVISAVPSAFVEKTNGNTNNLTINIVETLSNGEKNTISKTIVIENNAAGTYDVEGYKVYVDTKGNTQIRDCYIVQ